MKKLLVTIFVLYSSVCFAEPEFKLMISPEAISKKMAEVASKIDQDYRGEELTIVMVMKGAVCTTADLMRQIKTPAQLEFISASSYGENGTKSGKLTLSGAEKLDLKGKNVLVVDDIFDTGKTMMGILAQLKEKQPKTIKSMVTFVKKVDRKTTYRPEYMLFEIDNRFIVGYGLDYKEYYRGLPGVYEIKNVE